MCSQTCTETHDAPEAVPGHRRKEADTPSRAGRKTESKQGKQQSHSCERGRSEGMKEVTDGPGEARVSRVREGLAAGRRAGRGEVGPGAAAKRT